MIFDSLLSTSFRLASQVLLNLQPPQESILRPKSDASLLLYAHVPFCETLCPYCSFNRFVFEESAARSYFTSLREEMRQVHRLGYRFHSMYIGGGTPTILLDELARTIDLARELFNIGEVSCETNPNHLDRNTADVLGDRVQRMSVGVQSFDDGLLRKLNRLERFGTGLELVDRIQGMHGVFDSLNVDLIFNIPGQDEVILARDLELAQSTGANQLTFYPLMTSPTVRRAIETSMGTWSAATEARYYEQICATLAADYQLSSAWTFSSRGDTLIDEYIIANEEYLGLGSGSFSYLDNTLWVNTFSLNGYRKAVAAQRWPVAGMRSFSTVDRMRYRFLMDLFGLRLDKQRFQADFGVPVELGLPAEMAFFAAAGAFAENNARELTLTPRGRYLLVVMMREFFSMINRVRDQARKAVASENERTVAPRRAKSEAG